MQGGSLGVGYGLKYQARCLSDVKADTDQTSFIAGTLSLREENESSTCSSLTHLFTLMARAVRCNPEYDGMILSAGSDSTVNLWLASSFSSSNELSSECIVESPTRKVDPLLNSYSDYEDTVYGLAWSSWEPWIFASLSYDGRVVVDIAFLFGGFPLVKQCLRGDLL